MLSQLSNRGDCRAFALRKASAQKLLDHHRQAEPIWWPATPGKGRTAEMSKWRVPGNPPFGVSVGFWVLVFTETRTPMALTRATF